jgi:guanylate kinase
VIAGPSGVGKGSVVNGVLARDPERLGRSVSVTTREPRPSEREGVDYRFVSDEAFDRMVADHALLEWAEVVGHRSGTPREAVEEALEGGRDVILEIDVQGARQVRDRVPGALLIFLAPPSPDELERRLRGRGTESDERIALRLATADEELAQRSWFDHVVVNDRLQGTIDEVAAIIQASREASSRPVSEEPLP